MQYYLNVSSLTTILTIITPSSNQSDTPMKKKLLHLLVLPLLLLSHAYAQNLEQKIGQMLMVGFHGTHVSKESPICKAIGTYHIGGVILFDVNPVDKTKPKNIATKQQVAKLTQQLQACSYDGKLLIAIDQEGGKVQRLKRKYGFYGNFPQAQSVVQMNNREIQTAYEKMAKELKSVGVNYNLAPVVDLAINPKNYVIKGLGRSYGKEPQQVAHYANLFIEAMHTQGILTSLKHFPGHGSSLGDTHKGFVDVTNLWQTKELEPYRLLKHHADSVMVAHVFNKKLDTSRPASLSYATIGRKLRKELGFKGVVITDDLQMGAISKKYTLQETLSLAIGAGNDILLFGNQLDPTRVVTPKTLVTTIQQLIQNGTITTQHIERSYRRIQQLKRKL
jgi:beta-N-acetylhexosaminidase